MKTLLNIAKIGFLSFFLFNVNAFAEVSFSEHIKIGEEIYNRSFGRGCGACHDISSTPQLSELIQGGLLSKADYADAVINGIAGMPKAGDAMLATEAAQESGYDLDQAIDATYAYLENLGKDIGLSDLEKENAIILNPDLSFIVPVIKYVGPDGIEHYFKVGFSFAPRDDKFLFEPTTITEIIE